MRVGLVGATGLVGRRVIAFASAGDAVRIVGVSRREVPLPEGARVEMFVADPSKWYEVLDAVRPRALICALGTTWKKAGRDEATFRAVDHDLVVETAEAAHKAGVPNMVLVSAAGADKTSKTLYSRVKGETEAKISMIGFRRVDILRPGLLKGEREDDWRLLERVALLASPVIEPILPARYAGFRTIEVDRVAEAALGLARRRAQGRFTHDNDSIRRAAREWRNSS